MAKRKYRSDEIGPHRYAFENNKIKILLTQDICGICGKPVDKNLVWPNPLSPTVDHIIPVDKGGHPSSMDNLQLAHMACNRQKSNKILGEEQPVTKDGIISNRILPQHFNWAEYREKSGIKVNGGRSPLPLLS